MYFGISSHGFSWIQAGRTDWSQAYDLILQGSGGNIGIGKTPTEKLDVAGNILATGTIIGLNLINAQTGTTYTLVLTDNSKLITLSNAGAITLTIPTNATVAFPIGCQIDLVQLGAGAVTVAGVSGVTINSKGGNLTDRKSVV